MRQAGLDEKRARLKKRVEEVSSIKKLPALGRVEAAKAALADAGQKAALTEEQKLQRKEERWVLPLLLFRRRRDSCCRVLFCNMVCIAGAKGVSLFFFLLNFRCLVV